jgi:Fe-S oxidoreductase
VLEVLDALGVSYEVMGGTASCCGIQQFKRGDAKTAGRVSYNTIDRLSRPGASRSRCKRSRSRATHPSIEGR